MVQQVPCGTVTGAVWYRCRGLVTCGQGRRSSLTVWSPISRPLRRRPLSSSASMRSSCGWGQWFCVGGRGMAGSGVIMSPRVPPRVCSRNDTRSRAATLKRKEASQLEPPNHQGGHETNIVSADRCFLLRAATRSPAQTTSRFSLQNSDRNPLLEQAREKWNPDTDAAKVPAAKTLVA